MASLRFRNSALWQQQSPFFHAGFDMHTSVLARTQNIARIGKGRNDANRTCVCIHLPVGQQDFAFLRIGTAVRQDQFDGFPKKRMGCLLEVALFSFCTRTYSRSLMGKKALIGSTCETEVKTRWIQLSCRSELVQSPRSHPPAR